MATIQCPHCGMWIPVSGKGSETTVRKNEIKKSLDEILGDLKEPYWVCAGLFGSPKNLRPRESAELYVKLVREKGLPPVTVFRRAERYVKSVDEPRYICSLVKWLESQMDLPADIKEIEYAAKPGRFSSARRPE